MAGEMAASVKARVSAEEWRARVDCAALYRLVALHGWDDMIFTHISMRVANEKDPAGPHHFLINPYGMMFEEITASCLVKIDIEGEIVAPTPYFINPAGFTVHSAIHAAREDAHCVIHLHTDAGVGVSAQKDGLLPLTQNALLVRSHLAHHDYEGVALNLGERERLARDLGDKKLMLLRNHGTLSVGASAAEAFIGIFFLERACAQQVNALSAGAAGVLMAPRAAQEEAARQSAGLGMVAGLAWPGLKRKLDRALPGYDV